MSSPTRADPSEKRFRIKGSDIRRLVPSMGGCLATDMIVVEGRLVGYMYREAPDNDLDSGWRFFAGIETPEYFEDLSHTAVYDVNTVVNYDPSVIPYLEAPIGSAFERLPDGAAFERAPMPSGSEENV